MEKFFFDIPVYRLSLKKYNSDMESYIERLMYGTPPNDDQQLREFHKREPALKEQFEHHLMCNYGGSWQYNEIIGWVQLYFLDRQIRGEYWSTSAKRIIRTRKKLFKFQTWKLAPEHEVPHEASNEEIVLYIRQYLSACQKELKGRFFDTSRFDQIAPFVDWKALIYAAK